VIFQSPNSICRWIPWVDRHQLKVDTNAIILCWETDQYTPKVGFQPSFDSKILKMGIRVMKYKIFLGYGDKILIG